MASKIKYKTSFEDDWLMDNNFKSWISKIDNDAFLPGAEFATKLYLFRQGKHNNISFVHINPNNVCEITQH